MNNLLEYRRRACDRLEVLLSEHPKETTADAWLDAEIRELSGLLPRPGGKKPYVGLYGEDKTLETYRSMACDRLFALLAQLDLDDSDLDLDATIRVLSDLPERPTGANPYERLFVIKQEETPIVGSFSTPRKELITLIQLQQAIGNSRLNDRAAKMHSGLNDCLDKFGINTELRIAHFLAQILHESGGFRWLREIWGPSEAQLRYEPPTKLASKLGNTQKGDGKRFMGRGVIQLTGRHNYGLFSKAMGIDFVSQPELVENPMYATAVGGWYWQARNLNRPADRDDLIAVTRGVNGGTNGIADRQKYLRRAKQALGI